MRLSIPALTDGVFRRSLIKNIRRSDGCLSFNIGVSTTAAVSVRDDQLYISIDLPTSTMDMPIATSRDVIALIKTAVSLLDGS